jgi:hypothetical protein
MTTPSGMDQKSVVRGLELRLDTLIQGLQTAVPAGVTSIPVNGTMTTIADLIAQAQGAAKPYETGRAAHAVIRQLALTRQSDRETALTLLANVKPSIVALVGRTNVELTKFGFTPANLSRKRTSSAKKLEAAAQGQLTKADRSELGSKQRAAIPSAAAPQIQVSPQGEVKVSGAPPVSPPPPSSPGK